MKQNEAMRILHEKYQSNRIHISAAAHTLGFSRSWTRELLRRGMTEHQWYRVRRAKVAGQWGWYRIYKINNTPCKCSSCGVWMRARPHLGGGKRDYAKRAEPPFASQCVDCFEKRFEKGVR